jgi:predicted nuclease of predicted toxin-antitoxin system
VKFLVDMPLPPSLAGWLRSRGHTAVHASEIGLDRATDTEILTRANQEGRTVITADLDYPRLLALTGAEGPGLILFRGGDWNEPDVTARIGQVLHRMSESEIAQSVVVVDRMRVRRRRLPIAR